MLVSTNFDRLRGLESENVKLKKLLADAMLNNAALKDLLAKKCMVRPVRARSLDVTTVTVARGPSARKLEMPTETSATFASFRPRSPDREPQ
jgi:hypothetical protein